MSSEIIRSLGVAANLLRSFRQVPVNLDYVNNLIAVAREIRDIMSRIITELEGTVSECSSRRDSPGSDETYS